MNQTAQLMLYALRISHWSDVIEIMLLSGIVGCLQHWLMRDQTKPLVLWLHGFCLLALLTSVCHFSTLCSFFYLAAPIVVIALLIAHQDQLQKNFVTYRRFALLTNNNHEPWLKTVVQSCLQAAHQQHDLRLIIERRDCINTFLTDTITCNAPVSEELLRLLYTSVHYLPESMLIFSHNGTLNQINATWHPSLNDRLPTKTDAPWLQTALLVSSKTDCIIVASCAKTHSFTLIKNATEISSLTASAVMRILKHSLTAPSDSKGVVDESMVTKKRPERSRSL